MKCTASSEQSQLIIAIYPDTFISEQAASFADVGRESVRGYHESLHDQVGSTISDQTVSLHLTCYVTDRLHYVGVALHKSLIIVSCSVVQYFMIHIGYITHQRTTLYCILSNLLTF